MLFSTLPLYAMLVVLVPFALAIYNLYFKN